MLVSQLPPESATSTQMRLSVQEMLPGERPDAVEADPETEQWSRQDHLLAAIRDELLFIRWTYTSVNVKDELDWKPEPLVRPGVSAVNKQVHAPIEGTAAAMLAEHLSRTQGDETITTYS